MPVTSGKKQPQKKNATSFKPGKSGNPLGNPYAGIIAEIKSQIYKAATKEDRMKIFKAIVEKAKEGSLAHAEFLTDKWIGKVAQPIDLNANVTMTTAEVAKKVDDLLGLNRIASLTPSTN